jgi:flagellar basal body rod protein FlgG
LTNDLANVSTVGFKRTFEANIQPELAEDLASRGKTTRPRRQRVPKTG